MAPVQFQVGVSVDGTKLKPVVIRAKMHSWAKRREQAGEHIVLWHSATITANEKSVVISGPSGLPVEATREAEASLADYLQQAFA